MKWLLATVSVLMAASVFAQSMPISSIVQLLNSVNESPVQACGSQSAPSCQDAMTNVCARINTANGNVPGSYAFGPSARSEISEMERLDLTALADSRERLSPELQRAIGPQLEELRQLMSTENPSREWYDQVSEVRDRISDGIDELARQEVRSYTGPARSAGDLAYAQEVAEGRLYDQITEAKMRHQPRWERLEKIFTQVKAELRGLLERQPMNEEERVARLALLDQTTLALPHGLALEGLLGKILRQDCRQTMVNAMYMSADRSVSICGGLLYGLESESSIAFVMAHELAHAFNYDRTRGHILDNSPVGSIHQRVIAANGNMSCQEWSLAKSFMTGRPQRPASCEGNPYPNFLTCVARGTQVVPPEEIQRSNDAFFNSIDFCQMGSPTNPSVYLNPAEFTNRIFRNMAATEHMEFRGRIPAHIADDMPLAFYVAQEMRCNPRASCDSSLTSALEVMNGMGEQAQANLCMDGNLGGENESDWYAHQVMLQRVRALPAGPERLEYAANSMGMFCGYQYMSPHQEREFMENMDEVSELFMEIMSETQVHGDSGARLNGIMTPAMAEATGCRLPTEADSKMGNDSYMACQP